MYETYSGIRDVVTVLPSGGGKSLLFQLPGFIDQNDGFNLVFAPLKELIVDLISRCNSFNIKATKWTQDLDLCQQLSSPKIRDPIDSEDTLYTKYPSH